MGQILPVKPKIFSTPVEPEKNQNGMKSAAGVKVNRRKFPRRRFTRGVGVLIDGRYFVTEGVEIGEGGMSFKTQSQFPEGKQIVLSFQIPGGSFISIMSVIRNYTKSKNQETQHGCSFSGIEPEKRREVRLYVSSR